MSRAILLALLAVGCGRQLNPEYCAANPNDVECRAADLVMVDAPVGCPMIACTDQKQPVCEVSSGNCVQCLPPGMMGSDPMQCAADETCGQDRKCHACVVDTDCKDSKVCLSDGSCAMQSNVLYAAPAPNGTGNLCTIDMPCTFTTAVSLLGAKSIVKLTTTKGTDYSEPPIVVAASGTIIGTGATFIPMGAGPAISMTKQTNVEIVGLTISGATAQGILCSETKFQLRRATIIGSGGYGVQTTKCDATIERTKLMRNQAGGMFIADGTFEIRNNFVGPDNGSSALTQGNIRTDKAKGRIVFNTVAKNNSENGGGDRFGALKCGGSPDLLVAHNIFTSNGAANAEVGGDCDYFSNYVGTSNEFAEIKFASATDFHLTMMSPTSNPVIRDDPDADRSTSPAYDCRVTATDSAAYLDDIDGQARPYLLCDRGADEWRP
ncbi:MAG TPA: right-handed parallel beta-helix repeat-containing protein [Kofleriaceae bacterium]|nr:right-handed parallel beta-helix repeat-containing protein [Kofleriaceae bacterium]